MRLGYFILIMLSIFIFVVSLFTTNRLVRFCMYTPLKVLLAALVIGVFLWLAVNSVFNVEEVIPYLHISGRDLIPYPFFVCLICSMSSYTIFLCCIESVRVSKFHTFCSFFVYPLVIAFLTIVTQYDMEGHFLQTAYYSLAFIVPQIYFYYSFRRIVEKCDGVQSNKQHHRAK